MYRNLYLTETRLFVIFFASLGRSYKREKMPLFLGFNSVMSLPEASNKESLLLEWGLLLWILWQGQFIVWNHLKLYSFNPF